MAKMEQRFQYEGLTSNSVDLFAGNKDKEAFVGYESVAEYKDSTSTREMRWK